ncbi:MAG: PilZ domain-containing protein [Gammaproteobacteria bacterium]|nr:MAG: PilZ domain-containing protein [Gammaproteobacteria bacterium]
MDSDLRTKHREATFVNSPANERRQFYRIRTDAVIRVTPDGPDDGSPVSHAWSLMRRNLAQLDTEFSHLSGLLYDRDNKTVLAALKVLNRKIELMSRTLAMTEHDLTRQPAQPVSLSEGGVSWLSDRALADGDIVTLDMVLLPEFIGFHLSAKIQACEPEGNAWRLHARFENLSETDRQLLARIVLQHQQQARSDSD